jgi:hypothetical protein
MKERRQLRSILAQGNETGTEWLCLDPRFPMILPGARFSGMV